MDAPYYNGPPPDDDPEGRYQDDPGCEDCGATAEEPCHEGCGCSHCKRTRTKAQLEAALRKGAA